MMRELLDTLTYADIKAATKELGSLVMLLVADLCAEEGLDVETVIGVMRQNPECPFLVARLIVACDLKLADLGVPHLSISTGESKGFTLN